MKPIPLTRVATLVPFPRFLAGGGCEVVRAMERAGLAPELMHSPETFVPLRRAAVFVNEMARREGIDLLGLQVGAGTSLRDLGTFGYLLSKSLTMRDLLQRIVRHVPQVDTGAKAWIEQVPAHDAVRLCVRHHVDLGRRIIDGYALMVLLNAVRHAAGPDWRPAHVRFDTDRPRICVQMEALSEAKIETGSDHCAFEIPSRLLRNRLVIDNRATQRPDRPWNKPAANFVASLIEAIRGGFGSFIPDTTEAAELARMSIRTFQRRLKQEGFQFRELVDRVRFDEACKLLGNPSIPISELSRHLGYSDPANFTHAFCRWMGTSPSSYRELNATRLARA